MTSAMTIERRINLTVAIVAAIIFTAGIFLVPWQRGTVSAETPTTQGYAIGDPLPAGPPVPPAVVAAPTATQNTVTTTGPVTSDTKISVGTVAGDVLTWVVTVFSLPIGTLITAVLWKLMQRIGISMTDAMRARLQEIVINGLNIGAAKAAADLKGRGQVEIKNAAVANAVDYVKTHGVESLKAIGVDPSSNIATEAIKARIETAITDINTPTPKVLDPVVVAVRTPEPSTPSPLSQKLG